MSEGTLDDRYFEWLYGLVRAVSNKNPARSHWHLCRQLYTTRFFHFVPNDDNRALDGLELRYEFIEETEETDIDASWMLLECSILEMMIALARRAAFESDSEPADWFGIFLGNLEIDRYTDNVYNDHIAKEVKEKLDRLNRRTYGKDGTGGLFPLREAQQDQRTVELWYQMSAYLIEGDRVANGPYQ